MIICPYCESEMLLRSDKKSVYRRGEISVRYECLYMRCEQCGEEVQTEAQLETSRLNALEAYHSHMMHLWTVFTAIAMAVLFTSIFWKFA
jgi:phage terminase large subunit GpA-like protein